MIVEIANSGRRLSARDGFLCVDDNKLPLEDIDGVILATPAVTMTGEVLSRLAEQGISIVICDRAYRPVGYFLSIAGHSQAAGRVRTQADASASIKADLWCQIVKIKIALQAEALELSGRRNRAARLRSLAAYVRPGDPENLEARAARYYWPMLFGRNFRRLADGLPPNHALNYGYAVMRAALARSIAAHGLCPALGLHHANAGNSFCLADDLIEPFRPLVDARVASLPEALEPELSSDVRAALAEILDVEVNVGGKRYGIRSAVQSSVRSLVRALAGGKGRLIFPSSLTPPLAEVRDDAESVQTDVDVRAL